MRSFAGFPTSQNGDLLCSDVSKKLCAEGGPQLMFTLTNDTMLVGLLVGFLKVSSTYIDVKQSGKELTTCCPF